MSVSHFHTEPIMRIAVIRKAETSVIYVDAAVLIQITTRICDRYAHSLPMN